MKLKDGLKDKCQIKKQERQIVNGHLIHANRDKQSLLRVQLLQAIPLQSGSEKSLSVSLCANNKWK